MRRPFSSIALLALAALASAQGQARAQEAKGAPDVPTLKVEKYTLPNGLDVILHEDHTTPVVGVNLWYKVGSKDEKTGRTGFAHLFEHLMFQGSKHHDSEYFGPIEKVGAQINGSTNTDRTNYFETLPSNALELALWLESDRMGFLLPALTQAKLDNQRDVVKNERRQRIDNVPYGQSMEKMLEALYPPGHPYHHSVIGSMADLSAASLDDVSAFFRTYYVPNNASLTLAGDFQPEEAKRLIEKYFGPIPRGPDVAKLAPNVPKLDAPKHLMMTDRVALARAQLSWPTVPVGHPDEAALDVLASVLGQLDKENRLFLALMYDKQLAAGVSAFHPTSALTGVFGVSITARPKNTLDDLVAIADAEIKRLQEQGPTADEVRKAQAGTESGLIIGLQSATRKADFLNANNVNYGDPLAYKAELARLFAVTPADVQRVAKTYLTANRVRLDVNPGAPTVRAPEVAVDRDKQSPVNSPPAVAAATTFDRSVMPKVEGNPTFTPPKVERRKLSNGLELLVAERHGLPIVSMNLVVRGGGVLAPAGKEGLAELAADLMTEGTKTRDTLKLAGELSEIGASLGANGGLEASSLSMTTLTKHQDKALELFTDVLLNPTFPEKELVRLRNQKLAALMRRADSAEGIAGVVFPRLLYGTDHPYGRTDSPKSVRDLSRDDVVAIYKSLFVPNNTALIVVGDITPDAAVEALEKALAGWKSGEAPAHTLPEPPAAKPGIYLVDKPEAAQSVLVVGEVGVPRSTPDYFPLTVMNAILGGQFSSRINLNLREEKGYTYGARSGFDFRLGAGPFQATAPVQTAVTKEALSELHRELTEIAGTRPATEKELTFAKDRLVKGFPARFETNGGVAATLADLFIYGLPADYFATYQPNVEAVNGTDVTRVAKSYVNTGRMAILVVGDRTKVEPALKTLPFAKSIIVLDAEGNPATDAPKPSDEVK
ncbi:pitrilysin family protein [Isosphaeraceae bacterium EP7]